MGLLQPQAYATQLDDLPEVLQEQIGEDVTAFKSVPDLHSLMCTSRLWRSIGARSISTADVNCPDDLLRFPRGAKLRTLRMRFNTNAYHDAVHEVLASHSPSRVSLIDTRVDSLVMVSYASLRTLVITLHRSSNLDDLSPLRACHGLEELAISGEDYKRYDVSRWKLDSIGPIGDIRSLRSLRLKDLPILDVSPISSCTRIEILELSNLYIESISPISTLTRLAEFSTYSFNRRRPTDISAIRIVGGTLRKLELGHFEVNMDDFYGPVEACTGLTRLHLDDLFDPNLLLDLDHLVDLSVESGWTPVHTIPDTVLRRLTKFSVLNLCDLIDNLKLNQLSRLEDLSIEDDQDDVSNPHSLQHLTTLSSLTSLTIFCGSYSSLSPLSALTDLVRLRLSDESKWQVYDETELVRALPKLEIVHFKGWEVESDNVF
jgi:hypothetical protein